MGERLLIVDDHAGFRAQARGLLQADGFEVVGEAADGSSVMSAVRRLRPDLVLLDVHLPDIDGCEVARRLAAEEHPPAVVLISTREAADFGTRLDGCGARGYLTKSRLSRAALEDLLARG
jgi:DNA-binding NarL/FixJ family response regulator